MDDISNESSVPGYYTAAQLEGILQIDRKTIYKLADEEILPSTRLGRSIRFPKAAVHEVLESRTRHPKLRRKRNNSERTN